ncbi:MAG TPA: ATP-binding protein, partial [Steroidobacteraceae bacterium]|nr:ATP-binding protein [Steroidobacteraceae bacterium]
MSTPIARLLIVDDESAHMKALCDTLTVEGYSTTGFTSARRALETLRQEEFDLLLTDLMMPEMDGITLLTSARSIAPDVMGIVMTGHAAIDTAVKAMQAGALDYIVKPFKLNVILPVLNRALSMRQLRMANRQLEERVRQRTGELESANRQLEAVNRELESFSYSVSHDLRAPLRTVQGFCQMFLEDFGSGIPAEGRQLLDRVEAGARRMGQLIEDLLALSQLGRRPLIRGSLALEPLVRRLADELLARDTGRRVDVRVGKLDRCDADGSLLEQVLVNLLSNAFKFTRQRDPAIIEIDCERRSGETVYFVRDNGVGFKMEYAGKLFGVFQRLHSESEFEGTGVGLSIVQRIVQRHGGRIWAESEPGKGTTFYFTL